MISLATNIEQLPKVGTAYAKRLKKFGIKTALAFALRDQDWVKKYFTKPVQEIHGELNGNFHFELELSEKPNKFSVQKVKTFTPPSSSRDFVFSQLSKNIENACIKLRRHNLAAQTAVFFLKTQQFRYFGNEFKLNRPTNSPSELIKIAEDNFNGFWNPNFSYRATGVALLKIGEEKFGQLDLFGASLRARKLRRFFGAVDQAQKKHGKHTLCLATSFLAKEKAQHCGTRGLIPERKTNIFKGEGKRKRLAIPMFMCEIK